MATKLNTSLQLSAHKGVSPINTPAISIKKPESIKEVQEINDIQGVQNARVVQQESKPEPIFGGDDRLYEFKKANTAIPKKHAPKILGKHETFKKNPAPFPNHMSVIDTILDRTKVKKVSLADIDLLVQQYHENLQAKKFQQAKFTTLNDEREYYKDYFPNIQNKKNVLEREVEDLREQSRFMRENSRYDRREIDRQINNKQNYISEKDKLNMTTAEEIRRLEAETTALENQLNIPHQQPQAPVFEPEHKELDNFLDNYNQSQISQQVPARNHRSGYQEYRRSHSPGEFENNKKATHAYPYHNYDFGKSGVSGSSYLEESLFSKGSNQQVEVVSGGGFGNNAHPSSNKNPLMRSIRF